MKTTKQLFTTILLLLEFCFHVNGQSWLKNGLLAYYPFNGNANDESGHGNNGVAYGVMTTLDRFGRPNSAFAFNGTNAYIWIGTTVRPPILTATAWFQTSAITNLTGFGEDVLLRDRFHGWHLQVNLPSGAVDAAVSRTDGDQPWITTSSGHNDGRWHLATITYDGYTTSVYVDGVLGQQLTVTNYLGIWYNPGGLAIGRSGDFEGSYFWGAIDDVRIYGRALSSNEVAELYAIESAPYLRIHKAVYLTSESMQAGRNYQLQVSTDLTNWTNSGAVFTATNSNWRSPEYWDVGEWDRMSFRFLVAP